MEVLEPGALLKSYHTLESWVSGHARALDLVLSDLELALPNGSREPYTFHFAPDVYEIAEFGFSIRTVLLEAPNSLHSKTFRDNMLRDQIGRDFLFHGLPDSSHIVLLPPYKKELNSYLSLMVSQSNEIKDQETVLTNLHEISNAFEGDNLNEAGTLSVNPDELLAHGLTSRDFERWFGILVEHFKNLLFVAAGWMAQGLTALNGLFSEGKLEDPLSCFAGLIERDDIEIRKASGPWLRILNRWRKGQWTPNRRDARAIESVLRCNKSLVPDRSILLLVSSTEAMKHLVEYRKAAAEIALPSGEPTVFLRDIQYFQAFKAVAPHKTVDDFFSRAYAEAQEQKERLDEFKEWAPRVSELESSDGAVLETEEADIKEASGGAPAATSESAVYRELEEILSNINTLKDRIENVRYLDDRPEYARKHINQWAEQASGSFPYISDILTVIEKLEGQTEWHDYLRESLQALEKTLDGGLLEFSATATPYVQEYTPKKLESFIGFPFRAVVTNPGLKSRIAKLEELADERYWTQEGESSSQRAESVQRALQDLISCAMVLEDNDPDKIVVWCILFFAYGMTSAALAIAERWIQQTTIGPADESMRFLRALIIARQPNEKAYADALSLLDESATVYPESALFPHLSAFLVQQATMKKLDMPGYDLQRALSFCMSALEKVEKNTELHATVVNNAAYCHVLLYKLDQDIAHLNAIKRCVSDLNEIVGKMKMVWKPEWLDTKGTMHLLLARHAKEGHSEEDLQYHKGKAIECFKQALDIRVLEEGIDITNKHLRKAERL